MNCVAQFQVRWTVVIDAVERNQCRHTVEGEVQSSSLVGISKLLEYIVRDNIVKSVKHLPEIAHRCVSGRHVLLK